jgi:hypothetical protein
MYSLQYGVTSSKLIIIIIAWTTKFHIYWADRTFFVSEILGTKIKMSDGDIDMVNRDPNGINAHLGVRS